jgi:oxygen-independent coproporphyrinogen-3 oxidase
MTNALIREMKLMASNGFLKEEINTVYFGGGTPSLLSRPELSDLLETIFENWKVNPAAEITLEANPEDTTPDHCKEWKNIGINRISLGVQSLFDDELKWMHRLHHVNTSVKAVETIRDTGFDKFSVDFIYGSPFMTLKRWEETLEWINLHKLTHISCYALTVEPKTPLANSIKIKETLPPDNEQIAQQFEMLMSFAADNKWDHYEISNLAKTGHRSIHNSNYWQGIPYLGIGPSAHSYDGNCRRWNIADNKKYIEQINKNSLPYEEELLTLTQKMNEMLMIRLRCTEGCNTSIFENLFGKNVLNELLARTKKYFDSGEMAYENNALKLTYKGKLFADKITADLFF